MLTTKSEIPSLAKIFDRNQLKGDCLIPRVFIIKSEFDLFEYKKEIIMAIEKWTSIHPLLNTKFTKIDNEIDDSQSKLFYLFNQKFDLERNIKFLRFDKEDEDCWKYLIEYEKSRPFDSKNGPLWRIYFIDLNFQNYAIVTNTHHGITDGLNSFRIYQQLLKIIEDYCIFKDSSVNNSEWNYEHKFPNDPRFLKLPKMSSLSFERVPQIDIVIPESIRAEYIDYKMVKDGKFIDDQGRLFISTEEILQMCINNLSQFEIIDISSEDFSQLLTKCKENETKLTGCLEALLTFGFYDALQKHSNSKSIEFDFRYHTTINTRPYLDPKLKPETMGLWIAGFESSVRLDSNIKTQNFWCIAKENTRRLHTYLMNKQFFNEKEREEEERHYQKILDGCTVTDVHNVFLLTNIGKQDSTSKDSQGKIKINKFYSSESFTIDSDFCSVFTSCCSIEDQLLWGFSYNRRLYKQAFIRDWIQSIQSYLKSLLSQ